MTDAHLSDPEVVARLRATFDEIAEFIEQYPGVRSTGLANLYEILTDEHLAPAEVLRRYDRALTGTATIPGGFWDQYVPAPDHGIDREATDRLDGLRHRLDDVLEQWDRSS